MTYNIITKELKMILKNNATGQELTVPEGFSFTVLFFGVFVPLFRADIFGTLIMALAAMLTAGFSWFIFPFFYNKMYIDSLIKKGYSVKEN